ncbi:trigger factor [Wolinella succinogenes]|uniref:trigger factor n=1 Tax=Wolinella succinogenes TaxID=844 RepID=UPI00240A4523|nr:trigger factor [Wolinella succinogenes]
MNLQTQKINSANATAKGTLEKALLEEKLDKLSKDAAKNLKVDGFRKGKVPAGVIKARYGKKLQEDAEREALQELLDAALKDLGVEPSQLIGDPRITEYNKHDNGIDVEVKIGLAPEITLQESLTYVPSFELPSVSEEEINARLMELAKAKAPLTPAPEGKALENGDFAKIDFEGFLGEEAFEGGKAEDYMLQIGSKSFIPGFEDQLIGMKAGEKRDIQVKFPENYGPEKLAGQEATFKIALKEIQVKAPQEPSDEFAKSVLPEEPEANLNLLKEKIKEQIATEKKVELYNSELKTKLVDNLVEALAFDLPELVVEQEIDLVFRNTLSSLSKEEIETLRNDQEAVKAKREEHRESATRSVKVTFIVDALAKKEGIAVQDNELIQTIYYESMAMGQDPKAMLEYYKNNNLLPAVRMAMLEDKLLTHLLDQKIKG